jgi:hypothetical protein
LDVDKMLADLRLEREQIEEAILTLERLARGRGRRRGRPPSWLKEAQDGSGPEATSAPPDPKKRARSAAPARAKQVVAAQA